LFFPFVQRVHHPIKISQESSCRELRVEIWKALFDVGL
jgi:hypothetical protein